MRATAIRRKLRDFTGAGDESEDGGEGRATSINATDPRFRKRMSFASHCIIQVRTFTNANVVLNGRLKCLEWASRKICAAAAAAAAAMRSVRPSIRVRCSGHRSRMRDADRRPPDRRLGHHFGGKCHLEMRLHSLVASVRSFVRSGSSLSLARPWSSVPPSLPPSRLQLRIVFPFDDHYQ